jgi:hypothetical protein
MAEKSETEFLEILPRGAGRGKPSTLGEWAGGTAEARERGDGGGVQSGVAVARGKIERPPPPFILGVVNGILSPPDCNWTDEFRRMVNVQFPGAIVIQQEYFGLPLPWWQTAVQNKRLARDFTNKLERARRRYGHSVPLHLWAHSNGGPVVMDTLALSPSIAARTVILMAAACRADVGKNGVRKAWKAGALAKAVAWSNKGDTVISRWARLAGWLTFGLTWGRLGEIGFHGIRKGEPFENFRDPLPGHSDNFRPYFIKETFRLLCHQSGITS